MFSARSCWTASLVALVLCGHAFAQEKSPAERYKAAKRVLFLGDSITYAGGYVAAIDAWTYAQRWDKRPSVIGCGLPSETVSGLSEDGHAGGQFPRPEIHERVERVLANVKPDLVFTCYGMNCGVYQPLDDGRFAKYQDGYKRLRKTIERAGAVHIAITPPVYDDAIKPLPFSYNEVLDRYSDWLVSMREEGWTVIDLHRPMSEETALRRKDDPKFTFCPDAVHPNEAGQWFIAKTLIHALGGERASAAADPGAMLESLGAPASLMGQVAGRAGKLRDSYLFRSGHKRPGMAEGLPIEQAEAEAAKAEAEIVKSLAK